MTILMNMTTSDKFDDSDELDGFENNGNPDRLDKSDC